MHALQFRLSCDDGHILNEPAKLTNHVVFRVISLPPNSATALMQSMWLMQCVESTSWATVGKGHGDLCYSNDQRQCTCMFGCVYSPENHKYGDGAREC